MFWASLVAQLVKNLPAMQETPVGFLAWENPLEKGQASKLQFWGASLVAQLVKNLLEMQETWVWSLGWEDSPGEGKGYPLYYSVLENSMYCWGGEESDTTEQLSLSSMFQRLCCFLGLVTCLFFTTVTLNWCCYNIHFINKKAEIQRNWELAHSDTQSKWSQSSSWDPMVCLLKCSSDYKNFCFFFFFRMVVWYS